LTEKVSEFLSRLNLAVGRESPVMARQKPPLPNHKVARKMGIPVKVPGLHAMTTGDETPLPHSSTVPPSRPAALTKGRSPTPPFRIPVKHSLARGAGHNAS
jgi:hypothetical protein